MFRVELCDGSVNVTCASMLKGKEQRETRQ